jgi:hypothetical protein
MRSVPHGPILLLFLGPAVLAAQSVITVSPQQCVWRAGDDPAWAAPTIDESAWLPLAQWEMPDQPRFWIRCHTVLSSLRPLANPALQVYDRAAYEVYLDGGLVGANGNRATGFHYENSYETFPLDSSRIATGGNTIAIRSFLRVALSNFRNWWSLDVLAGDDQSLRERRDSLVVANGANWLPAAIGFGVTAVLGFVFAGLYFYDRSRPELLILAIVCWSLSCLRILQLLDASHIRIWDYEYSILTAAANFGTSQLPFFAFWLNHRRVPLAYKIATFLNVFIWICLLFGLLLPLDAAYQLIRVILSAPVFVWAFWPFFSSSLIAAFWPWRTIAPHVRPLAVCCFLWGLVDLIYFVPLVVATLSPTARALFFQVQPRLLEIRVFGVVSVIIALVALLFRDQQRMVRERAMLAGEMQAARAVQQVIVPVAIPSVPGFAIESIYKPAGEVGGDFFQILPTAAGGVLIVIGDVSGKGMPAALTVSLLVGTVRTLAHYTQCPSEILTAMNVRMLARSQGGFTTCLVLRAKVDGALRVANAGHLAPYLNGTELALENGLPLGLDAHSTYPESEFRLSPGAKLTVLSDGVVEARNAAGDLFGFERSAVISTESAETIAQTAQAFGQQDDITVLTLTRLSVPNQASAQQL